MHFILLLALLVVPQEHPEHPTNKKADKPAHSYSMDELATAITSAIQDTEKHFDGYYPILDEKTGKTLKLKFDHVHRERLAQIDAKTYFACTDFKDQDGHTVDVDFFMKDDGKKLVMSDATIHKIDGVARYNWKQKDGYWVREEVKA